MWMTLCDIHAGDWQIQRAKVNSLKGVYDNLRMHKDENISQYSVRFKGIVNEIVDAGGSIDLDDQVGKFLRTLLPSYSQKVTTINELMSVPNMVNSLEAVIGRLKAYELNELDTNGERVNNVETALNATLEKKSRTGGSTSSSSGKSWNERMKRCKAKLEALYEEARQQEGMESLLAHKFTKGKGKYEGKLPLKCFNCGKIGHIASQCRIKKEDDNEKETER